MQNRTQWFEQGLGSRIDALEIAMGSLKRGEAHDTAILRNLAHSLVAPAQMYGYHSISRAARAVDTATDEALTDSVRSLIDTLRQEAAKTSQAVITILIVGGDTSFNDQLREEIQAPCRRILCVDSAAEAQEAIQQGGVMFVVLNLLLPDLDGRSFLLKLREDTLTTAIPTLILAPMLTEEVREEARIIDADVLIENPPDTRTVSDRINSRLRRARETVKVARRDPATGLLNRAAFREAFTDTAEKALATNEPLALAVMSLDSPRSTLDKHGEESRKSILRRIGSIMSNSFRSTDIIARWGECDFVALFLGEDQLGGTKAIEKIVHLVANEEFLSASGERIHVTLSAGVTSVDAGHSVDDAMSDAHLYLFQASSDGGNQVLSSRSPTIVRTERVLLLVHDGLTSQVMKHLLKRDGFTVESFAQAATPLAPDLTDSKFHLIVIDEGIPPSGGFEILQDLRSLPQNSRTPMVMLVSQNAEESMARALELGANDYMMRPFSPFTFLRRMRRLLKKGLRDLDTATSGEICRVLIVDENKKLLLMAASALYERGGFLPLLAHGSADAQSRLKEISPDVVLLDADMARSQFDALVSDVLTDEGKSKPSIILTTTATESDEIKELADKIAKGIIRKPFEPLALGNQLEDALRMSPSSIRSPDSAAHLNNEIQRIMNSE